MSGILLHDGRRPGQLKWSLEAIQISVADGIIISPFSTPRVTLPRNPSGLDVVSKVRMIGGETIFDPTTHARLLPGVNRLEYYDTWELWGRDGVGLDQPARRLQHVECVFQRQAELGTPYLSPTLALDSPQATNARYAFETAQLARGLSPGSWQALAGRPSFWRAGHYLDAYVGRLSALRAPTWVLTMVNDLVPDHTPNLSDIEAFAGFCRTVHSLSERARVIIAHSDYAGLPSVAAGADTVGSGWDRAMRQFDPGAYRVRSDSPRIPASYVTQAGLAAVLKRETADIIDRWDARLAEVVRGGPMPPGDPMERIHHLRSVRDVVIGINSQSTRRERVARLRRHYDNAGAFFDQLITSLPGVIRPNDKEVWRDRPIGCLEAYAVPEGLW